ncbi:MAG: hypothetical protein KC420_14550 [Myxococcales bacterium]|nr:hypothetical protein [Myxococcales bacterium]MCB9566963.1 hypothetical protein [Myxococcales bacterium]MCB9704702.1 hypothetical protein [Myxococcales bacterium]
MDFTGNYRSLAFLLSLGGVPIACVGDDSSSGSDSATTTGGTTTGGTATTSGTTSAGTATDGSGSGTASGSTTGSTSGTSGSTSGTTTSETTGGSTTGEPPSPLCIGYANKYVECYMNPRYYDPGIAYCEEGLAYYATIGADCLAAFEEYVACLSALDCDDFMGDQVGCANEEDGLNKACGG